MGSYLLTSNARMVCSHELGRVVLSPSQTWVRVEGHPLLVEPDPRRRPIVGCPNLTVATKPCTATLRVRHGYSGLVTIDGRAVCLDGLRGSTDGMGGAFDYSVRRPGQQLLSEVSDV
jgi:hypothetical protein